MSFLAHKPFKCAPDNGNEFFFIFVIFLCRKIPDRTPEHDHLRAHLGSRLEQDGVHIHVRLDSRCFGLDDLGTPHFAALRSNEGVQGHILRLEGSDAVSLVSENAAESGGQNAFAHI